MPKPHVRVYYYPQCPWIIPTIRSIAEVARKLGYEWSIYDLSSEKLNVETLFKVSVDERVVPIGIGMTNGDEVLNRLLGIDMNFHEQSSTENIVSYRPKSKSEIAGSISIEPITIDNVDDEIDLCVGEDFLYGPMPQNFLEEARNMKRRWLQYLLSEFEDCGYVAYLKKSPSGFVEFVPGEFAKKLGIKTYHSPRQTAVILCLSVKKGCWGMGVGSKLLLRLKKDLSPANYKYVEVMAYKSGVWHPVDFYLKNNFEVIKELESSLQMAYQL